VKAEDIEKLAEYAHEAWSGWMEYMFELCWEDDNGNYIISEELVSRWLRLKNTDYKNLTEIEKVSDKDEAKKILKILGIK